MYVNYYKRVKARNEEDLEAAIKRAEGQIGTFELDCTKASVRIKRLKVENANTNVFETSVAPAIREFYALNPFEDEEDIDVCYQTFQIPKSSGGMRTIVAPLDDLKILQKKMLRHLQKDCKLLPHNCAHSYIKHRNCQTALQVHQQRHARFFLKLDIHDFFGRCTEDLVYEALKNCVATTHLSSPSIKEQLKFLFKKGVLPQGAPTSPILSNIVMLETDVKLQKALKERGMCYTRYADDILISKNTSFRYDEIVRLVQEALPQGMQLSAHKTRYGSCNGSNWNLGLMYNKDLDITVGYGQKHKIKCAYHNLYRDMPDDFEKELGRLIGLFQYYKFIEPEYFTALETKLNALGYKTR